MRRALNSWKTGFKTEHGDAWTLTQTRLAEVLRWSSATVEQACSWASIANDSANAYTARLIAAAGAALGGLKKP